MKTTKISDAQLLCEMRGDGWDTKTALMELANYRQWGRKGLTETPRKAIEKAIRRINAAKVVPAKTKTSTQVTHCESWQTNETAVSCFASELYGSRRTETDAQETQTRLSGRPTRLPMVFN